MTRHPVTGRALEQPSPPPLRVFAAVDKNDKCEPHQPIAAAGRMMCRCELCGTVWDGLGRVAGLGQPPPRAKQAPQKRKK